MMTMIVITRIITQLGKNMINKTELKEKIAKNIKGNLSLEKQTNFFLDAIAESAPEMPDIWTGGRSSRGKESYKSIRLIWRNEKTRKWIEFCLCDTVMGYLDVYGNKTEIRWLATEKGAKEAFQSAFRYVFGA